MCGTNFVCLHSFFLAVRISYELTAYQKTDYWNCFNCLRLFCLRTRFHLLLILSLPSWIQFASTLSRSILVTPRYSSSTLAIPLLLIAFCAHVKVSMMMSLHPLVICSQLSPSFPCLLHDIPTSNCLWSAVETGLLYLLCLSVVIVIWILRFLLLFQSQFDTKEAYHKAVGYNEEDGGIESEESYISRVESYMRLYGAIVQVSPLISSVSMLILHVVILPKLLYLF